MKQDTERVHVFAMMMVSLSILISYALGTLDMATSLLLLILSTLTWLVVRQEEVQ